jgi:hypothetical protein
MAVMHREPRVRAVGIINRVVKRYHQLNSTLR